MRNILCGLVTLVCISTVSSQINRYVSPVSFQANYHSGAVPFPGQALASEFLTSNGRYVSSASSQAYQQQGSSQQQVLPQQKLTSQQQLVSQQQLSSQQLNTQQLPLEHRNNVASQNIKATNNIVTNTQHSSPTEIPVINNSPTPAPAPGDIFSFIQGQLGASTPKTLLENPFNFKPSSTGASSSGSSQSDSSSQGSSQTSSGSALTSIGNAGGSSISNILSSSFGKPPSTVSPARPTAGLSGLSGLLNLLRPPQLSGSSSASGTSSDSSREGLAGGLSLLSRFLELPAELLRLKIYFFTTFLRSILKAKLNLLRAVFDNNIAVLKATGSVARGVQAGVTGAADSLSQALTENSQAIARNSDTFGSNLNASLNFIGNLGADAMTNSRTLATGLNKGTQGFLNGVFSNFQQGGQIRELTKEITQNIAQRTEQLGVQAGKSISDLNRNKIRQIESFLSTINDLLKTDPTILGGGFKNIFPNLDIFNVLRGGSQASSSGSTLGLSGLQNLFKLPGAESSQTTSSDSTTSEDLLSNLTLNDLTDLEGTVKSLGLESSDLLTLLSRFRRSAIEEGIDPQLVLTNSELEKIIRNMKKFE